MEKFRNVEAVLMLLFGGVCAGACVLEPPTPARIAAIASAAPVAAPAVLVVPMAVVVITGKRLTPAQKRAEIEAEAAAGRAS
jgi:hypothetical protein